MPEGEASDQEDGGPDQALGHLAKSILPDSARLKVMAMIIQPIVSSMIAEASPHPPDVAQR